MKKTYYRDLDTEKTGGSDQTTEETTEEIPQEPEPPLSLVDGSEILMEDTDCKARKVILVKKDKQYQVEKPLNNIVSKIFTDLKKAKQHFIFQIGNSHNF
jgi:hypothetical protein